MEKKNIPEKVNLFIKLTPDELSVVDGVELSVVDGVVFSVKEKSFHPQKWLVIFQFSLIGS